MQLKIWSTIICFQLSIGSFAQNNGQVPQVSVVTPNEAALFRADEQPLGNFTGTIPVNIPLYTLTCGSLGVPISVGYHMGGIKAEEIASNVGLGWSLQAGGSITRLMHGIPDDEHSPGTGFLYSSPKPSGFTNYYTMAMADLVLKGYLDMEPDLYCYNFNGESGQFFFDESGNVVMKQQTALQVTPVFNSYTISGWVITDESGINYYFGYNKSKTVQYVDYASITYLSTSNTPNMPGYVPYNTTWHLAEIDDMNGENQVVFTYANTQTQYTTNSGAYGPTDFINLTLCSIEDEYTDNVMLTSQTQEMYLTKVQCRSEYVLLNTSINRTDYLGGAKLDSLNIYDSTGILKKSWHLNYDYFYANNAPLGPSPYYQRLKLLNIAAFGPIRSDSLPYSFTYYQGINLPIRNSYAMDYWGYYNGEDNNGTMIPNLIYTAYGQNVRATGMGKREANAIYGQANSLTRITYPTGGYRSFTYEGNQALLPANDQIQPDPAYTANRSFPDTANYQGTNTPAASHTFTINSADGAAEFTYIISNYTTGTYYVSIYLVTTAGSQLMRTFNNAPSGLITLGNGNYRLDAYMSLPGTFGTVNGSWTESTLSNISVTRENESVLNNNRTIGGLRIKQVDDFDPVSGKTYTTQYSYKCYSSDSTLSSGLLVSPIVVASPSGPCGGRQACQYLRRTANCTFPLSSAGGDYVYYTEVRTRRVGNGWVDRMFNFRLDGDNWYYFLDQEPLGSMPDYSFAREKPISEITYDQSSNLLRKTQNTYQELYYQSGQGYKMKGYYHEPGALGCSDGVLCHACYTSYNIGTGYYVLVGSLDSLYGSGGAQSLLTSYTYSSNYGSPQIQSVKHYINNNEVKTDNYRYAFNNLADFTLPLSTSDQAMKATLLTNHFFQPLETTTTISPSGGNPSFVQGTKYTYGYFNGSAIHLNTLKQFKTLTDSIITNYVGYDVHGNLTEQYKLGDAHTVWLWGYWRSVPVAKIVGSTYSSVMALVNDGTLQQPATDQALRDEINKIRTGLPTNSVQVSTYSYIPIIGMTSTVDPAGTVNYYEYDNYGRLMDVRDLHNNILKTIDYHHQGQP